MAMANLDQDMVCDALRYRTKAVLKKHMVHDAEVLRVLDNVIKNHLVLRIVKDLYTDTLLSEHRTHLYETPASWWQMFKRDVLGIKNYKKKCRTLSINIKHMLTFPDYVPPPEELGRAFKGQQCHIEEEE